MEAEICLPMTTPLIHCPRLRHSRARCPSTPQAKQSHRGQAASGYATVQAQRVLLKKLGVEVQEDEPDPDIDEKFKVAFRGDMSEYKQQCLQILLNGRFDVTTMDLNLDGLEAECA